MLFKGEKRVLPRIKLLFLVLNCLNWGIGFFCLVIAGLTMMYSDFLFAVLSEEFTPNSAELASQSWQGLMILAIPITYAMHRIFRAIGSIIDSAIAGNPFVEHNAVLLRTIGWALLAIQILNLVSGFLFARLVVALGESAAVGESVGADLALTGWLAALLMFVLAHIFEHGARLRDEVDGTV